MADCQFRATNDALVGWRVLARSRTRCRAINSVFNEGAALETTTLSPGQLSRPRSSLVMKASGSGTPSALPGSPAGAESGQPEHSCGGEACDAVFRGFFAFFDRSLHGLDGNGRSCADCHSPADQFQLSPASAEARFKLLQARRRWNPKADDPLFRPIDADDFRLNGARASDFRNLRENGLVRIEFSLPPNMRLIDPATNLPSAETSVDVWRMVPSVNDVKLTGPDGVNPGPRDPNRAGGYQLDARWRRGLRRGARRIG